MIISVTVVRVFVSQEVSESAETSEAAIETGVISTNGVETYYERQGSGPEIVFVHGFIMDTRMWAPQIEVLANDFTVVTYDLRGHGRTGGSAASLYSAALLAADLEALVTALDLDQPVICGLSMGGMVAQEYASTYPENLSGLVLSDTFTPNALPIGGGLAMPHLVVFSALSHVINYKRLNSFQNRVGNVFAPRMVGDRAFHEALVEKGPTMAATEFRKGIGAILAFTRSNFDAAGINVPTLVMYGEHEPSPIRTMAEHLVRQVSGPTVELIVVPNAGHGSSWDNPSFFNDVVHRLAERTWPGTPAASSHPDSDQTTEPNTYTD